jgi:ATP-dependent Clp protease protease subunit
VQINSPGGDMFEGIAIYNVLREHPQDITVKVMGMAASAASIIAMAGDTVEIGAASSS